ncbi:MAG: amidophosphoribosyltransferase, partial [Elusimicrobia bacterium]|nr:amidophosphoribosyltransferase [Elusimicrobiota bacterium]
MEENCGVFGLCSVDKKHVVEDIYYGIFKLQHRGQQYCGMATSSSSNIRI